VHDAGNDEVNEPNWRKQHHGDDWVIEKTLARRPEYVGVERLTNKKEHSQADEANQRNKRRDAPATNPGVTEPYLKDKIKRNAQRPGKRVVRPNRESPKPA
jgi:hypothetical protein